MGENETCCIPQSKVSIKDYLSENSAIIKDLKITINSICVFLVNDDKSKEEVKQAEVDCLMTELRQQNDDLKTIIEKASKILNTLR